MVKPVNPRPVSARVHAVCCFACTSVPAVLLASPRLVVLLASPAVIPRLVPKRAVSVSCGTLFVAILPIWHDNGTSSGD